MKRFIVLVMLVSSIQNIFAQTDNEKSGRIFKKFKTDISVGYALPQTSETDGGVLFAIEPKYAVLDQLSIGLRLEAAVTAKIDNSGNSTSSAKANASYLLTGDYYLNNNKFRPFGGIGAGVYTTASVDDNSNINSIADIPTSSKFGFMTRIGFEYGHLRLGAEYNFVANKSGYLGLKLGACIGGGRK